MKVFNVTIRRNYNGKVETIRTREENLEAVKDVCSYNNIDILSIEEVIDLEVNA
ncbi:MAG: hypothetical protein ACI4WW_02660 [Candidatus Coprovivens sp.]